MIKKFENFDGGETIDPKLEEELRFILDKLIIAFDGGNIYHFPERYGRGRKLINLARRTEDTNIREILHNVSSFCLEQFEWKSDDIESFIGQSNLDDLAEFLGEPPIVWSEMEGVFNRDDDDVYSWDDDDYQDSDEEDEEQDD